VAIWENYILNMLNGTIETIETIGTIRKAACDYSIPDAPEIFWKPSKSKV
jgi:hypothetical protein